MRAQAGPFQLSITLDPNRMPAQDTDRDIRIQGDMYWFESPRYFGQLNFRSNVGHLACNPVRAFESIDYCIRVITAVKAFEAGGLLVHGAGAIAANGFGLLLFGKSGDGKTTASRFLEQDPRFICLNDDLVLLQPDGGDWKLISTPFTNPSQSQPRSGQTRLDQMFVLHKATKDELVELSPAAQLARFLGVIPVIPLDQDKLPSLMHRITQIVMSVPVNQINFRKRADFIDYLLQPRKSPPQASS
jgi:hypothetical protein